LDCRQIDTTQLYGWPPPIFACRLYAFSRSKCGRYSRMPYRPHRLEPNYPGPEVATTPSPAPPVVVECWCGMVERMDRLALDRFTRDIWRRFDHRDLEPLSGRSSAGGACLRCNSAGSGPRATPRSAGDRAREKAWGSVASRYDCPIIVLLYARAIERVMRTIAHADTAVRGAISGYCFVASSFAKVRVVRGEVRGGDLAHHRSVHQGFRRQLPEPREESRPRTDPLGRTRQAVRSGTGVANRGPAPSRPPALPFPRAVSPSN
jgi:hypothetical protein